MSSITTDSPTWSTRLGAALQSRVIQIGVLMITAQLIFRGWASFNAWFYGDDFQFLAENHNKSLTLKYLFTAHDQHLMPGGKLLSWLVAQGGTYNWELAAAFLVGLQAMASVSALLTLYVLFGDRPGILIPLGFYLFSTITLTAFMWWSAAIELIPLQIAFFWCVIFLTLALRTRKRRWQLLTAVCFAAALFFHNKGLIFLVGLPWLALLFFTDRQERLTARCWDLIKRIWVLWALLVALAAAYAIFLATHMPALSKIGDNIAYADLADTMLRISLGVSLVGGPWVWSDNNPPLGLVVSPAWSVMAAWLFIALVVTRLVMAKIGDLRALLLPLPYLAAAYAVTALGRGAHFGGFSGIELRYLADSAPIIMVSIAFFFMRSREAAAADTRVNFKALTRPGKAVVTAACCIFLVGAAVSNVRYARVWAGPYPTKVYVQNVIGASKGNPLFLADAPVPSNVLSGTTFPHNLPSRLFRPLGDRVTATTSGTDLDALANDGIPSRAWVNGPTETQPGPITNCGTRISDKPTVMPTNGKTPEFFWWLQVSYLADDDGLLTITTGKKKQVVPLERGAHNLYLQGADSIDPLTLSIQDRGLKLCVDRVGIGTLTALGGPL